MTPNHGHVILRRDVIDFSDHRTPAADLGDRVHARLVYPALRWALSPAYIAVARGDSGSAAACTGESSMPILPLENDEPFALTLGVMLFPEADGDSPSKQALAYRSQYLAEPIRHLFAAGLDLPHVYLAQLAMDSGQPLSDIEQRWKMGLAAGQLLWIAYTLGNRRPERCSWNNAVRLLEAQAGRQRGYSRTFLWEAKAEFESVIHLWAAWYVRGQEDWAVNDSEYAGLRQYLRFLDDAGAFLEWGRGFRGKAAKSEYMLSADAWIPPADWGRRRAELMDPSPGKIPLVALNRADVAALRLRGRPAAA